MTKTTIDLAPIALNLSSSSDTAAPGSIGVCRDESTFNKSLQDAMHIANKLVDVGSDDADQGLPPDRQDLPPEGTFDLGLEGLQEVIALVDAMAGVTDSFAEINPKLLTPRVPLVEAYTSVTGTISSSTAADEHFYGDLKQHIQPLRDSVILTTQDARTVTTNALLVAENHSNKENRHSSIESQAAISLAAQQKNQPVAPLKEVQAPQPQVANKAPYVVSTTELASHLRVLKSSGGGEARLQLHPAELGRMTVSLTTEGSEARVAFVVDKFKRGKPSKQLPRLRDLMDGAGLSLADADVSERDADKSMSQSDTQMSEDSLTSSPENEELLVQSAVAASTHLIDAFA